MNFKIRVLHITWSGEIGGIERLVYTLSKEQSKDLEMEVGVLFGRGRGHFFKQMNKLNINIYTLNLKSGYDFKPGKLKACVDIMKSYDILHYHGFCFPLALAGILSGQKIIYTFHGPSQNILRNKLFKRLFKKRLFEYFFNTFVDFCTANSSYTRKRVIESYNINSEKIVVVHNGIELDFMSNVSLRKSKGGKLENNSDTYIVGTVCRFDSLKRIDRLLAAFAHFISQYKLKAKLFLIGDGPVRSSLENFAKDLGVDRYTVFTGYQENVSIWLRNLNVFVLPSEGEAFGLALVEAMLAQKPVIVFADSGGLLELVKDGKTGFIAKNEKQLADILFTLYQNPGLRAKIGKEAAGIVKREFSIEAMNRKLKKVYLEVAKCQA